MDVYNPIPTATVSPPRQRMLDDMRMRQFAPHTQDSYIRAVRELSTFLGRSPHTATAVDLSRFHCISSTPAPARSPSTPRSPG